MIVKFFQFCRAALQHPWILWCCPLLRQLVCFIIQHHILFQGKKKKKRKEGETCFSYGMRIKRVFGKRLTVRLCFSFLSHMWVLCLFYWVNICGRCRLSLVNIHRPRVSVFPGCCTEWGSDHRDGDQWGLLKRRHCSIVFASGKKASVQINNSMYFAFQMGRLASQMRKI